MPIFLCDQMLIGLGKWLRAAGYDTVFIEKSEKDRDILNLAVREGRILLTRDKHFTRMEAPQGVIVYLLANSIEACVKELSYKVKIDWFLRPFSRCLFCNTLLLDKFDKGFLRQVPERVMRECNKFTYCPQCHKIYWEGSHTKNMLKQLKVWQDFKIV